MSEGEGAGRAILAELRSLRAEVAEVKALLLRGAAPSAPTVAAVASDSDIDDPEWGDKPVRTDPPRWKGDKHKGEKWSACPPDYLDALAGFHDWAAGKKRTDAGAATGDEKTKLSKYAGYEEADAAKVRAWARRIRATAPTDLEL